MTRKNKQVLQLGMPYGTACARLRKTILFDLVKKLNLNMCYRCKLQIATESDLSIEHKTSWYNSSNPHELFFDLNNISFSHLLCNTVAAHKGKRRSKCPSLNNYKLRKCRCRPCVLMALESRNKNKAKHKVKRDSLRLP